MFDVQQAISAPIRWLFEAVAIGSLLLVPLVVYLGANRAGLVFLAAAAAVALLLVVPTLLAVMTFYRRPATRAAAPVWGMALNSAALVIVCLLLRQTVGIGRTSLLAAWLTWTLALLVAAWRPGESLARLAEWARGYGSAAAIGLAASLVGVLLMFPEQFQQCFNEDGTETYELAQSLHDHFLPYRELETWDPIPGGRMGTVVVNPSLINSYWTLGLLMLIDQRETATRLSFWIWSLGGFLVAVRLARPQGRRFWAALPLAALMLLAAVHFTFYVGYDRYMSDIGNPGVTDALCTMFLLMSYDSLARGTRWAWAASILMAALVLYAGPVMFVLNVGAMVLWQPIPRRQTLRWATTAGGLLLTTAVLYTAWGWHDDSLRYWIDTLDQEYVNHYLAQQFANGQLVHVSRWISAPLFLGYFVLGAGGITAVGIVAALRRDAWQRTVATVTLLYLAIVLGSGFKNLHWLAPLWPVPLILFLRARNGNESMDLVGCAKHGHAAGTVRCANQVNTSGEYPDGSAPCETHHGAADSLRALYVSHIRRSLVATASILICIGVSWPRQRACFTLNRELGRQTTILTDRYLSAATWARLRRVLRDGRQMGWNCDAWTWVIYSEVTSRPLELRPLVLTDDTVPSSGYSLLASRPVEGTAIVARLFCRSKQVEQWLKTASSSEPVDRYPWVYQPLATGDYSPHDNRIEDVQRLGW